MIRSLFATLLASFIFLSPALVRAQAPAEEPRVIDGIAAIVNGEVITLGQVRALTQPREHLLRQQLKGEELEKQIAAVRKEALQDLIDRQLIVQSFKKESLTLPEYFVDQRVSEIIRDNFGGDRNTFIKTLEAQNYSLGEFKKNELEKIIVSAMRGKNIKPSTTASPARIAKYYHDHLADFSSKEEVHLRMIMVPSRAAEGNSASQKSMAEEILGKLAGGADFARMAQMYSEDSTRDLGGDWGWIERKTLAPELEKIAFGLPLNKVSRIVELGGNYYILRVDERRGGAVKSLAEVRGDIEKKLLQEESQRLQENWLAGLRQKATIRTF